MPRQDFHAVIGDGHQRVVLAFFLPSGRMPPAYGAFPGGIVRSEEAVSDHRMAARLKAMGLQWGWSDFTLVSPEGRFHALELKRRGGSMSEEQGAFAAWCERQGIPFACTDDPREAAAILSGGGVLRIRVA